MKELLKNKWFVIISIVLIVGIVALIFFGVKKYLDSQDAYSRESRQNFSNSSLTYENLEYENMANRLLDAMDRFNTDESAVKSVLLKLKNADDWYKLVNVFGVRKCESTWLAFDGGNLSEWLVYVHDTSEQEEISSILSAIGVNF